MTKATNVNKFQQDFNFTKQYFELSYRLFRDDMELKDFIEWRTMMSVDKKPIDFGKFVDCFDYSATVYDYYYDYLYWWNQMQILTKRSKLTLIEGGKK